MIESRHFPSGRFRRRLSRRRQAGYNFLEVLISLIILTAGVLSILHFFPQTLQSARRAEMLTQAALLAQMKAEEIRRDSDPGGELINQIRNLTEPTPPIPFARDTRLAYSFASRSAFDPVDDPGDPRDDVGVPRIIVRYNPEFRPSSEVIYELRFDR